jgi:hypothetical protein
MIVRAMISAAKPCASRGLGHGLVLEHDLMKRQIFGLTWLFRDGSKLRELAGCRD